MTAPPPEVVRVGAPRPVVVVGPTAAGKTALGVRLARALGGEVVNADSMQLYAGMDIGTAKPSRAERAGVHHRLLDVWPVTHTASVAGYQRLALPVVRHLLDRGVTPVVVGGSGLYVRAVVDDLRFPGTDPSVRARLEAELDAVGAPALHRRLAGVDPDAAAGILPSNGRRVVRALEVVEIAGSFSAFLPEHGPPRWGALLVGLDPGVAAVDEAVALRVRRMLDTGLLEEVRRLERRGLRSGRTASRALGYAQALALADGLLPDEEAFVVETVRATRRFVRRQRSWFRRDPRITWFPDADTAYAGAIAALDRRPPS